MTITQRAVLSGGRGNSDTVPVGAANRIALLTEEQALYSHGHRVGKGPS